MKTYKTIGDAHIFEATETKIKGSYAVLKKNIEDNPLSQPDNTILEVESIDQYLVYDELRIAYIAKLTNGKYIDNKSITEINN